MTNTSIHAFTMEGDPSTFYKYLKTLELQSTPSLWKATKANKSDVYSKQTSIHAFTMEGD